MQTPQPQHPYQPGPHDLTPASPGMRRAEARLSARLAQARAALDDITELNAERLNRYRNALAKFDWSHEWSDDMAVVPRGRAALEHLRELQLDVDPGGELWREAAPVGYEGPVVSRISNQSDKRGHPTGPSR